MGLYGSHIETFFSIKISKLRSKLPTGGGNETNTAPVAVADFKCSGQNRLGGLVPFKGNYSFVCIPDFMSALLELLHGHVDAVQQVDRFKSGHGDGDFVFVGDGRVFPVTHDGADVPSSQESLHPVGG